MVDPLIFEDDPETADYRAQLEALGPGPQLDTTEEPGFEQTGLQRFLEGLAGAEETPFAAPRTFGQGLISGLTRGLGRIGTKTRGERLKFQERAEKRQAERDEANRKATEEFRKSQSALTAKISGSQAKAKAKQGDYERDNLKPTPEQLKKAPWLAEAVDANGRVPRATLEAAFKPGKPEKESEFGFDPASLNALDTKIRSDPDIKKFRDIKFGYDLVQTGATLNTPQGDLSLIFGYMKMLDPESVVREGEFANAENTRGVPEAIRQRYNRLLSGDKLSPQQRKEFTTAAGAIFEKVRPASEAARKRYRRQAKVLKVPEVLLFDDEEATTATGPDQRQSILNAPPAGAYVPGGAFDSNRPRR